MSKRTRGARKVKTATSPDAPAVKYGPRGITALPERKRVEAMLERDAAEAERMAKFKKRSDDFDIPAKLANYATIDPRKPENQRRYRSLPAEHPLVKAWTRGKIDAQQFNAGNSYRVIFEKANDPTGGKDSTQAMAINRSQTGAGMATILKEVIDAKSAQKAVERHLSAVDRLIVIQFCGKGVSMASAVHGATTCATSGVLFRVHEALNSLIHAIRRAGVDPGDTFKAAV